MSVKTQFKATHQQADGAGFLPYERKFTVKAADKDANGQVFIPVDKGSLILGMVVRCVTAVNGATPSVKVGDKVTTGLETFVAAASDINDAGDIISTLVDKQPLYFATPGYILVTLNTDATAGELELRVLYSGV